MPPSTAQSKPVGLSMMSGGMVGITVGTIEGASEGACEMGVTVGPNVGVSDGPWLFEGVDVGDSVGTEVLEGISHICALQTLLLS